MAQADPQRRAAQQQRRDDAGQEAEARPEVQDRGVLGAAEEGAQAERVAGLVADHVSDFLSKSLFFSPIVVYICRNITENHNDSKRGVLCCLSNVSYFLR